MKRIPPTRAALLLLVAALAACSDAPTGAALDGKITPPENGPARNTAATITVTNSGGYPLVSWDAVPGAISYTVRLVTTYLFTDTGGTQRTRQDLGTTTGTAFLDTSHVYTGDTSCARPAEYPFGPRIDRYEYVVIAQLASGTTTQRVDAPIGECY